MPLLLLTIAGVFPSRTAVLSWSVGVAQTPGLSGRIKTLLGMAMDFLACDREQAFLMPPDPRDWLPDGHLAWFVLASVEEMHLEAFYGSYCQDGWGRAAFEPSMMVALLMYAYARGERSSRGIERRCVEVVAYRVIAAQQTPDHATIARFRVRHEAALAGLFSEVLRLGLAGAMRSCATFSPVTSAAGSTENARPWSSPCSPKPSTTGASTSSSDEADPPHARNGG